MKTAIVFATDMFEDIELIAPVDILRRADIDTKIISLTKNLEITSNHNIKIKANKLFTSDISADAFILPGGGVLKAYLAHKELQTLILKQFEQNKLIAAICAAPSLLGHLGILKNKNVTGYPDEFYRNYLKDGNISKNKVVADKNIITAISAASAIDFGLEIVKILDEEKYADVCEKLVY